MQNFIKKLDNGYIKGDRRGREEEKGPLKKYNQLYNDL